MKLAETPHVELIADARMGGLQFRAGRFVVRLYTPLAWVVEVVQRMYAECERLNQPFSDFTIRLVRGRGLHRWYRPQARFALDRQFPFAPLPLAHAYPLLEWGLNWCVYQHCHQYLIIHAAVVEKNGRALILPGVPGAGKSTLTAFLTGRGGWRLLSDELALIDLENGLLHPNPRPISLKNASIDLVRRGLPGCELSPLVRDTLKGTVAHLRPTAQSIARTNTPARPSLIVFPRYAPDTVTALEPLPQGEAFMHMADNAFNYGILGETAFHALARVVGQSRCYMFPNSGDVDQTLALMDERIAE